MSRNVFSVMLAVAALAALAGSHACSSGEGGTDIGHGRIGLGCYSNAQCGLDSCVLTDFPGGACVGTCDDAGACPPDLDGSAPYVCIGAVNVGACLRGCESDGGCLRDGWLCQAGANDTRVCLPDCRGDESLCANAGADYQCNTLDGICSIPPSTDAGIYGRCNSRIECADSATCLALNGQQGGDGFCTVECAPDGGSCPGGGSCLVTWTRDDGGSESLCGVPCATDGGQCAAGLSCQTFDGGPAFDGGAIALQLCAPY